MKTIKSQDGIILKECIGRGLVVLHLDGKNEVFDNTMHCGITHKYNGEEHEVALHITDEYNMLQVTIKCNSDHILIMKEILKEMGEI